ncbi:response regulator [Gracilibacillus boraciitolerans]|uniref:response regulator n=1 Tax=Gracilibacillus boraciitolerans TaxID=307521 RepID=UPI0004B3FFA5
MTKVLIVDDEKVERDGLEKILQSYFSNMIIQQAQNGRTALQMVKTFQPELILMDIKMPGMSGIEVIRQIKSEHAGIKFIMMTAYAEFDYARSALKLGVVDYLVKPSSVQEIITTVERILVQITKENKKQELEKQQEHTLQKAMSLFETDVVTQLLFDHVHDVHIEELMEILDMHGTQEKFVISLILPKGLDVHYTVIKEIVRKRGGGAWVGGRYMDISYRLLYFAIRSNHFEPRQPY